VDESWNTVAVRVTVSKTGLSGSLTRDGDRWLSRGEEMTTLAGCSDAALAVSPSTFTLPIRRLKLAVGESAEVEAAALAFPTLDLDPVVQRYTRLHDRVWRVEPAIGADPVDIEVDDAGMVVSYPERWRREATSTLG
jgi:hypothetical protein